MSPTRPYSTVSRLLGVLLLTAACGSGTREAAPPWPERPAPAYPGPQGEAEPAPATNSPAPEAEGPPGSALAKQYSGKGAESVLEGKATYYADSLRGHPTASGEPYEPTAFTAAHKKLPFGTIVRVVRKDNGAVTYARVNDRGPFGPANRIIDLSRAAAVELDMLRAGVIDVRIEVVGKTSAK